MKVGFLIPTLAAGGAERVVVRLANYLVGCGIEAAIICTQSGKAAYEVNPSVSIITLQDLRPDTLESCLQRERIDILSDHYHWSIQHVRDVAALSKSGFKVILSEHNSYFYPLFQYSFEGKSEGIQSYLERPRLYESFSAVTSLTRYSSNLLASELKNIVLMPNPMSYDSAKIVEKPGRRVLTVSSFQKAAKRLDLMVKVFGRVSRRVSNSTLRIVGEFDLARFLEFCEDYSVLPQAVETIGLSNNVEEHYLSSAVFAMTSEIEGQPMALLEAACHGLPQVVFRIPGIEDQVLHGETGYIVDFGDTETFAEHISVLLRDETLRNSMGRRARDFVLKEFAVDTIGKRWIRLLSEVHSKGSPSDEMLWKCEAAGSAALSALVPDLNRWVLNITTPYRAPKVSVIVPVYRTEELLTRCLDSLLGQTLGEIEIIVVSDASPGNVAEIVANYREKDRRVRYIEHEVNLGLYQARSTGARAAQGSYLAHVDSDDFVHPDFLRRLHEAALLTGADIVECRAVEVRQDQSRLEFNNCYKPYIEQPELSSAFINHKIRHVVWNKLYRKSMWDKAPLHMEFSDRISITEDLLRNAPLFLTAKSYAFVDAVLYYYVRREFSVVTSGDFGKMLDKLTDVNKVYDTVADHFANAGVDNKELLPLQERHLSDLQWYMQNGFRHDDAEMNERLNLAGKRFGIFAALAVRQQKIIAELSHFQDEFWRAEKARLWEQEQKEALEQRLEESEKGRIWERERADFAESRLRSSSEFDVNTP